jgi:hypothetical protein
MQEAVMKLPLLRTKFDFTGVDGIKRAYKPIFGENAIAPLDSLPVIVLEATRRVLAIGYWLLR